MDEEDLIGEDVVPPQVIPEDVEDILEQVQEHIPEEPLTGEFTKYQIDIMKCIGLLG